MPEILMSGNVREYIDTIKHIPEVMPSEAMLIHISLVYAGQ